MPSGLHACQAGERVSDHSLADSLLDAAEHQLEPLDAGTGYNHLSVRAAAAIYLDRLLGAALPIR